MHIRPPIFGALVACLLAANALPAQNAPVIGARFASPQDLEAHAMRAWAQGDEATARREVAVATAYRWLGQRYQWGGVGYDGIDCSALMRASYKRAGLDLPRTSKEQARLGRELGRNPNLLTAGDLLIFGTKGTVSHVGMVLGGGYFVHAAGSAKGVIVSNIYDASWQRLWMGTRRIIVASSIAAPTE